MNESSIPALRIRNLNAAAVNRSGAFVLYWMIANRRAQWNFSLQRAVEWAKYLDKPLVVLEALRCGYRWASDRFHRFVIDGMADHARQFHEAGVFYYPYVEPEIDAGKGLLAALSKPACVIVTDEFPAFMLPRMVASAAQQVPIKMEQVDANGLLPLRATEQVFPTAYSFRRFLQKNLFPHLCEFPAADPLAKAKIKKLNRLPAEITKRWPHASAELLTGEAAALAALPIDHKVTIVDYHGGPVAGQQAIDRFLEQRLPRYADDRNQPEEEVASGLSPYLHFGHVSVHQIFRQVMEREEWMLNKLSPTATGSKSGWWGVSVPAEAFLDELITWRELGFNMCSKRNDYDRFASLPDWAKKTLNEHANDRRVYTYTLKQLETGETHDPLWNAAQMQLVREGRIHNYLRMLWGKKILEWSATPQQALKTMIELNNKYAVDGRDPNSYSGIFWCLGRYDRPWGPVRPIFGTIRYMSSENTARKVSVKDYIRKYAT